MAEKIYTENAPAAIGPYSQAIKAGNVIYTSGQIAIVPGFCGVQRSVRQVYHREAGKKLRRCQGSAEGSAGRG